MNHQRLLSLFWEFSEYIEDLHTLYLDSLVGYSILHERLQLHQESTKQILGDHEYATEEFQDTCSIAYRNISNKDYSVVSMSPVMRQGAIKLRVQEDGQNTILIGRQCLVSAYSYWEEYLRIEIGKALGVLPANAIANKETRKALNEHVVSDFWGDIRHIRNSIVHSNSTANSDISKCKLLKWFKPGEKIVLNHQRMRSIFLLLGIYRNELHALSLPRQTFNVPGVKT